MLVLLDERFETVGIYEIPLGPLVTEIQRPGSNDARAASSGFMAEETLPARIAGQKDHLAVRS